LTNEELYLHEETIVTLFNGNISNSWTMVFPMDPMRFAIAIPSHPSADLVFAFADSNPSDYQFHSTPNSIQLVLTRYMLGDMICRAFWSRALAAGSALAYPAVSYSPKRWSVYQRWVRDNIPK
jgi:hypothetical protein